MKLISDRFAAFFAVMFAFGFVLCVSAEDEAADGKAEPAKEQTVQEPAKDPAPKSEAKEEAPKKKKGPNKKPEYNSFDEVAAVADAWEQPIIVLVGIQGDKETNWLRRSTVGLPGFKEICPLNAPYYTINIPQVKEKKTRGRKQVKKDKDAKPKPDMEAVKKSEQKALNTMTSGGATAPFVAVVSSNGSVLGLVDFNPEAKHHLGSMVKDFKSAFEKGKFTFTINGKLQKLLDKEAKDIAKEEKMKQIMNK